MTIRRFFLFMALAGMLPSVAAVAQESSEFKPFRPEVEIDTSVLDALDPGLAPDPVYNPRPLPRSSAAAANTGRPVLTPVESFPVQSTVRSESTNPGLAPTPQTAPPAGVPLKLSSAPLPPRKPKTVIASRSEKAPRVATTKIADVSRATPPLPRRRPAVARASETFVRQARIESRREQELQKPPRKVVARDASVPSQRSVPRMPAVPPVRVDQENLLPARQPVTTPRPPSAPVQGAEALAGQIIVADRQDIVRSVEAIASQVEGQKSQKFVRQAEQKTTDLPSTVIVEADRLTRAEKVASVKAREEISDITASMIEPGAGNARQENLSDISATIPRPVSRAARPGEKEFVTLSFTPALSEVNAETVQIMKGRILKVLQNNPGWRVQIQAFASAPDDSAGSARRLSLSRALSVRSWLMDQGIEPRRMDVRALGTDAEDSRSDRVDFVFFDPSENKE